jgi:hypothetical protein
MDMVRTAQLLTAMTLLLALQPVQAQGMEAGQMQSMIPSSTIGPDQDSLLPPEVVPVDPSSASAMSANQYRPASMPEMQPSNVPGLAQNPQDMRNQALNQLYGGQTQMPANAGQQIWRAGQQAQQPQGVQMPAGMAGMGNQQAGAPNFQMANNHPEQGFIAQSQTLTGGSNNQPQTQNTRRGGFTNRLNFGSALGMGLMSGAFTRNPMMGVGMLGTAMTGLGSFRNTSR